MAGDTAAAYGANAPKNCFGPAWDGEHTMVVAKITASPRVYFIKSPNDDDRKAEACPSAAASCRKSSYLVTGDLVLVGETQGDFTCVSYRMPPAKHRSWTEGWLPSTALTPVAPTPSPKVQDWTGTWDQQHSRVEIKPGENGKLHIDGIAVFPTARDFHNGVLNAQATPRKDTIAFAEDGSILFDTPGDGCCRVRMQRIGPWLMVEDNGECGGMGVTFTGLYHRKD
jgi:hypothetical protein